MQGEDGLKNSPSFDKSDTTVIFVLGGPGAGKGTQCARINKEFPKIIHLSAGELLREEQARPDSPLGTIIISCINNGTIVPMHITISLLENAMKSHPEATAFLIDGFPRSIDQGEEFERKVCESTAVIFYDCPQDVMRDRLLKRGAISGRTDDNPETISKRFTTYVKSTLPVIDFYRSKVFTINSNDQEDVIYKDTIGILSKLLKQKGKELF
jgi:UMP-CMP kinase